VFGRPGSTAAIGQVQSVTALEWPPRSSHSHVHTPHQTIHAWKGFLVHIAAIVVGLLLALAECRPTYDTGRPRREAVRAAGELRAKPLAVTVSRMGGHKTQSFPLVPELNGPSRCRPL